MADTGRTLTLGQRHVLAPGWLQRTDPNRCCNPFTVHLSTRTPAVQARLGVLGPQLRQVNHPRIQARAAPPATARTWSSSKPSTCSATASAGR